MSPFNAYEAAAAAWNRAVEIDRTFGTNYAASLVAPMRAAWAAYLASK